MQASAGVGDVRFLHDDSRSFLHAPETLDAISQERRRLMPQALYSFIQENGRVIVGHIFFGKDEAEAEKWKKHHLESCEYFRAANREGRTIEFSAELDDLPEPEQEDLELYVFGDEEDEFDEEEEDEEEEEDDDEED